MKHPVRNAVFAICGLLIAGSIIAYLATGMYPYTRFRDAQIEQANQQTELSELFGETGAPASDGDDQPEDSQVESVNAIGLLPSGPGMASLSVATLSGVGVVGIAGAWWLGRRQKKKSEPRSPGDAEAQA